MVKYIPQLRIRRPPRWVTLTAFIIHFALIAAIILKVLPQCDGVIVTQRTLDVICLTFFLTFICPVIMATALVFANVVSVSSNARLAKETTPAHVLFGVTAALLTAPSGLLFVSSFFPDIIRFTNIVGFLLTAVVVSGTSLVIFASEQIIAAEHSRN